MISDPRNKEINTAEKLISIIPVRSYRAAAPADKTTVHSGKWDQLND